MSIETLDYIINFNGHTVTCFEVGSVPTIGYASIEDAMTGTNPVIVPECIFEAACALLDQGVHLTAIYAHVGEETWMQWDEIPEELTAEDIVAIEDEDSIRKQAVNRKQRRAVRIDRNKEKKRSDRAHGKRRPDSAKDLRRWENDQAQMERPQVLWCQNHKGEYVPSKIIDRKYHEKRFDESARSQFDHTPFDEDVWDFVANLADPLDQEKVGDYWNSPSDFLITTSVLQEDAWMRLERGHYVLYEVGTVYYKDRDGEHAEDWERETVIY